MEKSIEYMQRLLDDDQIKIEILRLNNDGWSNRKIAVEVGTSSTTIDAFLNKKTYTDWWALNSKPIAAGTTYDHHSNIKKLNKKRYILTSAQNNTFVHAGFFGALKTMAKHIDAEIIVGTFSYNKNGFRNNKDEDEEWFDHKIVEYINNEPTQLVDGLIWCGELNILPTAVNPLSGLHSYTKSMSGIVPHPKVQLESLPTHKQDLCRMMYTTGSVTMQNYVQKKAGQKAAFHHVFGALLVEVDDDGDFFVRQLSAESLTGNFYDLDNYYTEDDVCEGVRSEAMNWGDLHSEKKDEIAYQLAFGRDSGSMIDVLKPKYQFGNDLLDFSSRNHHNIGDPYFRFKSHYRGHDSVLDNINDVINTLYYMDRDFCQTVVVESNHDLALERWLKNSDYKDDPENAIFFLECQLEKYRSMVEMNDDFSIFEWAVKRHEDELEGVEFLRTDESFKICDEDGEGIECGSHGHIGSNGARGGVTAFQRMGSRYNVGHSHSAAIKDGVYYAGVMGKLDMGYNKGGSSWSQSSVVTYANGKRAIITIRNGKWRA